MKSGLVSGRDIEKYCIEIYYSPGVREKGFCWIPRKHSEKIGLSKSDTR